MTSNTWARPFQHFKSLNYSFLIAIIHNLEHYPRSTAASFIDPRQTVRRFDQTIFKNDLIFKVTQSATSSKQYNTSKLVESFDAGNDSSWSIGLTKNSSKCVLVIPRLQLYN